MRGAIDYHFENDEIRYRVANFDMTKRLPNINEESGSISVIDAPPINNDHYKTIRAELSEKEVKIARLGNSAIEFAVLNHEVSPDNGVIIYNMGIGGDFHHPVGAREVEVLAYVNPDQQIVVINNTGSGASSLIPRETMKQMKQDSICKPQGVLMLQILEKQLQQYGDRIELMGNSAGARVAIGMTAAFSAAGQNIANLRVVDPVSAADRLPLGVQMRLISQVVAMSGYGKSPYNEGSELKNIPANLFTARGAMIDNWMNYPLVVRRASGLEADLDSAMSAVRGDLAVIQPERSEFARTNDMRELITKVAIRHSGNYPETLRHIIIEGHSHAIMSKNAGALPLITLHEIAKQK
jgi:hypothetical protein